MGRGGEKTKPIQSQTKPIRQEGIAGQDSCLSATLKGKNLLTQGWSLMAKSRF